jgi:hypothetical protein
MKLSTFLKLEYIYGKVIGSRYQWYQLKAHGGPVVKSKRPTIKLIHFCKTGER